MYKTEATYYPPAGGGGRGLPRVRAGVRLRDGEALHAAAQHGGGLALRLGAQTQHRGQQNTRSVLHLSSSGTQPRPPDLIIDVCLDISFFKNNFLPKIYCSLNIQRK